MAEEPFAAQSQARLERLLERAARRSQTLASAPRSGREADGDRLVIATVDRDASYPLAVAQERFWFLNRLHPESPADNVAVALRLDGRFDGDAYQRAWDRILARHDILRTRFVVERDQPVQIVGPAAHAVIRQVDLAASSSSGEAEAEALAAAAIEADRPFDLAVPPLRLTVYRLSETAHIILVVFHHIVCDLWSIGVLSRELAEGYSAAVESRSPQFLPVPFQYVDYAVCHRQWIDGPALTAQFDYWRRRLSGLVVHELPADGLATRGAGEGATGAVALPPDLIREVKALASREGVTPFMVLAAAMFLLIGRYTGESEVVVGTPIANRTRLDLKALVGTFVNTLVLRAELSDLGTFRELLSRTREVALGAFAHQDVPFHRLVTDLGADRAAGRRPPFQVLFNVHNAPVRFPDLPGLGVAHVPLPRRAAQFDLSVSVDTDVLQQVGYSYDTSRFKAATVEQFVAHYVSVLRAVTRRPETALSDIDLLPSDERASMVRPAPPAAPPASETIVDRFEGQVALQPHAVAIASGDEQISYRGLDARVATIAGRLRARGVGPGTLVGVCLHRGVNLVATLLAVMRCRAAYVPLDPSFPRERLTFMVRDSGLALVVTDPELAGLLPPDAALAFIGAMLEPAAEAPDAAPIPDRMDPDDLAYVIYTSGSTGVPKGVEVSHRSLANVLVSMADRPGLAHGDRLLAVTTISFDIAAVEIFLPLLVGATIVMATGNDSRDPTRLAALLGDGGITVMQATPSTWRMLIDAGWRGHPDALAIWSGGEALSRELAEALLRRGRAVWNLFGPTETTIWSTVESVTSGTGPVGIGNPIANTDLQILDDQRRPTPVGVPGELYIGGVGVARGYRNRPELTAERFVASAVAAGERLYRTGDRVRRLPDGGLHWLGRFDSQVKIRGHRVEIGEVEACLERVPDVGNGVVVALADRHGEYSLVAFVVGSGGGDVDTRAVRDHLARALPNYMVPSRVELLQALPMTPNGKVDRAALVRIANADAVVENRPPASETERRLCAIWADVLGAQTVGVDEDFFDLGGHSLLAVRLVSAIERELGQSLSVATMLDLRTVRQLAWFVDRSRAGET